MKGTYVLLIEVIEKIEIKVGALGQLEFEPGSYVYIGSALNGIEQRVSRHLSADKKLHWHIDYLLDDKNVDVERIFYKETEDKKEECRTAEKISDSGKPVKDFGCSDCGCESHLFYLEDEEKFSEEMGEIGFSRLETEELL